MTRHVQFLFSIYLFLASPLGIAADDACTTAYINKDYAQTLIACDAPAKAGDSNAQNILGFLFFNGYGVKQDYGQAIYWLQKAADQGNTKAQFRLGYMYLNGLGVPKDYKQALLWAERAGNQGDPNAQLLAGLVYYAGGNGVSQDYKQAFSWAQKAADQGDADAESLVGNFYFNGWGVDKDYRLAISWFQKAADQGNAGAQFSVGVMYLNGYGMNEDYKQALSWMKKSADQGNANAESLVGNFYFNGWGVDKDYKQAISWYQKAADQGNEDARHSLEQANNELKKIELAEKQVADDAARGYKRLSFEDYELDAEHMRLGSKIIITGTYRIEGDIESLAENPAAALLPNGFKLYLLTADAPRETRRNLLELRRGSCGLQGICRLTVLGHTSKCSLMIYGRRVRTQVCLAVDEIRS